MRRWGSFADERCLAEECCLVEVLTSFLEELGIEGNAKGLDERSEEELQKLFDELKNLMSVDDSLKLKFKIFVDDIDKINKLINALADKRCEQDIVNYFKEIIKEDEDLEGEFNVCMVYGGCRSEMQTRGRLPLGGSTEYHLGESVHEWGTLKKDDSDNYFPERYHFPGHYSPEDLVHLSNTLKRGLGDYFSKGKWEP